MQRASRKVAILSLNCNGRISETVQYRSRTEVAIDDS